MHNQTSPSPLLWICVVLFPYAYQVYEESFPGFDLWALAFVCVWFVHAVVRFSCQCSATVKHMLFDWWIFSQTPCAVHFPSRTKLKVPPAPSPPCRGPLPNQVITREDPAMCQSYLSRFSRVFRLICILPTKSEDDRISQNFSSCSVSSWFWQIHAPFPGDLCSSLMGCLLNYINPCLLFFRMESTTPALNGCRGFRDHPIKRWRTLDFIRWRRWRPQQKCMYWSDVTF